MKYNDSHNTYSENIIKDDKIRNFLLDDPLLDWLELYGNINNLPQKIIKQSAFDDFLRVQSNSFESSVINNLNSDFNGSLVPNTLDISERCVVTLNEMKKGKPIIYNGGIFNKNNNIYSIPCLLVRSDYINKIFKNSIITIDKKGCKFSKHWHYIIIHISYSNIHIPNNIILNKSKNIKILKGRLYLQNLGLSRIQKYLPKFSLIIAKKYILKDINHYQLDYTAPVYFDKELSIINKTNNAIKWLKELIKNGKNWNINNLNFYPNMCNQSSENIWDNIKKKIAENNKEITKLWSCGINERKRALELDINTWDRCNSEVLGIKGKRKKILDNIISINNTECNILISPRKLKKSENIHLLKNDKLEFYVDFEMVNDLNIEHPYDIIFMIGCLTVYYENNKRCIEYKNFTTDILSKDCEISITNNWIEYMDNYKIKYNCKNPKLYHWGNAEKIQFRNLKNYHTNYNLITPKFVDLLDIFKNEPIVIKDSFNFGLKNIAETMYKHKMIETIWDDKNIDGKEAMVYAWKANDIAIKQNKCMKNIYYMKNILKYNYYDCKVLQEIADYIRGHLL